LADHEFALRAAGIAAHALVQAGRSMDALTLIAHWQPFAEREAGQVPLIETSPLLRAQYRSARFLALLHVGRLAEAEAVARDAYARSLGDGTTEATALMAMGSGLVMLLRGDLRAARRWLHEAVELLREADPSGSLPFALALNAQALGQAGDSAGSTHAAAEAEEARRPGTTWVFDADLLLGHAWAAAAEGALTEAQEAALEAVELAGRRSGLAAAVLAAHDLVRLGDAGNASARLTHLVLEVQGSLVTACAEHAEALLSGDGQRLERAASTFAQMGAWLWAAEAESEAASVHRRSGRESSASAAAARAALLLERCEGARTPALALAGPVEDLTPREREIAILAARGASNREIAEKLVVSVRTVENSLQRAYRKLGVRNRHRLADVLGVPE
jgi:DNA-binding CsgD family transcriptional regulator